MSRFDGSKKKESESGGNVYSYIQSYYHPFGRVSKDFGENSEPIHPSKTTSVAVYIFYKVGSNLVLNYKCDSRN